MPLIRDAQAAQLAKDAVVLNLGDLQLQAELLRARAQERANAIVADARAEAQRLTEGAEEKGFAQGKEEGFAQGKAEGIEAGKAEALVQEQQSLQQIQAAWIETLQSFEADRDGLLLAARTDAMRLAVAMGECVIKRSIAGDTDAATRQLEAALALIIDPTKLRVAVSPADVDRVRSALPVLLRHVDDSVHVEVAPDESLSAGSCVVRTKRGSVDATIETQAARVVDALLPSLPQEGETTAGGTSL